MTVFTRFSVPGIELGFSTVPTIEGQSRVGVGYGTVESVIRGFSSDGVAGTNAAMALVSKASQGGRLTKIARDFGHQVEASISLASGRPHQRVMPTEDELDRNPFTLVPSRGVDSFRVLDQGVLPFSAAFLLDNLPYRHGPYDKEAPVEMAYLIRELVNAASSLGVEQLFIAAPGPNDFGGRDVTTKFIFKVLLASLDGDIATAYGVKLPKEVIVFSNDLFVGKNIGIATMSILGKMALKRGHTLSGARLSRPITHATQASKGDGIALAPWVRAMKLAAKNVDV